MNESQLANSSFLIKYQGDIDEVFRIYLEDINPFIVQFEVLKNEFPIEVQNEIRAIYGHLVRASLAKTDEEAKNNIQKMRSHTKRALLDCFKYSCIVITDMYNDFFEHYKNVDFTFINEGTFLVQIQKAYKQATFLFKSVKIKELSNISEDELFEEYQKAYNHFADIQDKLDKVVGQAEHLKHKATRKERLAIASFIFGIAGFVVGIIGVII